MESMEIAKKNMEGIRLSSFERLVLEEEKQN